MMRIFVNFLCYKVTNLCNVNCYQFLSIIYHFNHILVKFWYSTEIWGTLMPVSPPRQPFFTCLCSTHLYSGKLFTKPDSLWMQILSFLLTKSSLHADKFYMTSYKIIFKPWKYIIKAWKYITKAWKYILKPWK